jgi:NAD(P)-dependent dehydrogenase (short-subunit alcohol dehydrogenase family)
MLATEPRAEPRSAGKSLRRPVALVTGGAGGIGSATCRGLADLGYAVVVNHLGSADDAARLASTIDGTAIEADVADLAAVVDMFIEIERTLGPVAVVVCGAGFSEVSPIDALSASQWDRMLAVHLGGAFNVIRAAVPSMSLVSAAAIVTIASELALSGSAERAHYVSAKAALIGLTKSVAHELAPLGITANCVAPGPIDTPLLTPHHRSAEFVQALPLRRLGTPSEVADAVTYLVRARWTTGQVLSPNGGAVIQ